MDKPLAPPVSEAGLTPPLGTTLRTIIAHPFLALAREFGWDDRQLAAAKKLIDITTIRVEELAVDQRVIGHGEGQEHTIADVNAGRVEDLIQPRLAAPLPDLSAQLNGWEIVYTLNEAAKRLSESGADDVADRLRILCNRLGAR